MKVKWLQNFDNEHKDSVWYGGDIVEIIKGKYHIIIGAYGDISMMINGNYYKDKVNGGCFKEYLNENGIYNDKDLKNAFQDGKIEWLNNNWFEAFVWDSKRKDWIGNSWDCVIDELDKDDDFSWVEDWLKQFKGW